MDVPETERNTTRSAGQGGTQLDQYLWERHTRAALHSLDHMPDCPYRRFVGWMAAQPRYADRWFQLSDLTAQARMAQELLSGLFTRDEWVCLVDHIALMNVHQSYETFSDNLAIGLAAPREPRHQASEDRRAVLLAFNDAMLARLGGKADAEEVRARILGLRPRARAVSVFRQSLGESEYRELAGAFLSAHPDVDPEGIEFDVAPVLLANIETAFAQVENMSGHATTRPLRAGLARRYSAVTRQLTQPPFSPRELLSVGTDSVLVVPTIVYCAGVIAELVRPAPGYAAVLAGGGLEHAANAAALSIRLLNDCGTQLLEQSREDHERLVMGLREVHASEGGGGATLSDLLLRAQADHGELLTRFTKDLLFGEFNVCLDGIRDLPVTSATLALLEGRLDHVRAEYRDARSSMLYATLSLTRGLGDDVLSVLIHRFVDFQRSTYSHAFDSTLGEYAIPLSPEPAP
ncbi:hypothetical protein [Streptomyces formicae]|uniref:Uncharacterized protein n=1 Tax=Streptomyces formicae TaxID=1616117 RepID=A0ABY3WI28_9ACTN|nr:hypothetical protein [Streptomyces formicae]UNM11815.1 hypothetical protein J4032_09900 [Streptomyces formicae]